MHDDLRLSVGSETLPPTDAPSHQVSSCELLVVRNTDIHEQHEMSERLRENENWLMGIINSAMDAIITVDEDQHILIFNAAAEKMFRCKAADLLGKPLDHLIPERFRAPHSGHIRNFGETQVTRRVMGELGAIYGRRIDGEEFPIEASISQVEVAGRKLFTVILRDITERKRTEEALRESEALFSTVFQVSPISISISRLDNGQYITVNETFLKRYEFSLEEVIGHTSAELGLWASPEERRELMEQLLEQGKIFNFETHYRKRSGELGDVLVSAEIIEQAGEKYMLSLGYDLTERKRAELEVHRLNAELEERVLQRTAQLEAANKELEAFSYSVSHDLRAPLRTVDGFSQAVLEDFAPQLPEDGRRYLQIIREGAQRMGMLIDDLLSFSRLSRQSFNKRVVHNKQIVLEVLNELSAEQQGREVEIRIGDLPACEGDPTLLKQVWINLLSNALKYSRERRPAIIEIGCLAASDEQVYFVRDNGTGFDMQYAHKLFGVFQRLHRAEDFEGTGVGLAIVQRVVHRHGGRVWAEAAIDRGATFYFTLQGELN